MAKEKILVVDDEEDILELVRYNLVKEGYQVTGALTGTSPHAKGRRKNSGVAMRNWLPSIRRRSPPTRT